MFLTKNVLIMRALDRILNISFILFFSSFIILAGNFAEIFAQKLTDQEIIAVEIEATQTASVWNEDSYRRALLLYKKLAQDWKSKANLQKYAESLREAADLSMSLNEPDDAWQMLSDSLSAERKIKNIAGESETLSALTMVALWKKNLESAGKLHKKAVALAESSRQPRSIAKAAFVAAEFNYRNQRNLLLMTELQEKALRLYREANDRNGELQTLTMLAYTAVMNNDRIKGQAYATEAVQLARLTDNKKALAFALIASGDAYQRVGNWQDAHHLFKEAEAIYPENLDPTEKAILFVRFGFHYETFNDLIQARSYFQNARELFIKCGNLYGNSELATRIGEISLVLGEKDKAFHSFNEGLQIGIQANDKYSQAYAYENMGELSFSQKNYKEALEYYQKALLKFNQIGIKHAVSSVKEKIGELYFQQGNKSLAKQFYLEALQIQKDIRNRDGQANNLFNLAKVFQSEQQIELGLTYIEESLKLTDLIQGETANKKLKQSYLAEMFNRSELYINLLMKQHLQSPEKNYVLEALQAAEKSRARSMLENLSLAEFTKDADLETVKREKETRALLNTKADKLTDLLSENADKNETDKISGEINELENELEDIKATLKQNSPIYSAIKNPAPFDVGEFQRNILDENSLLLEFSFGKTESYLWVVSKTEVSSYILPPREQIEVHIETLRKLIEAREKKQNEEIEDFQKRINEAENNYQLEARQLSNKLFGQIADKLTNKRLIIVPDGKLHYFPVSALPLPNSETNTPILLTNETVYEPSAQTLSILSKSNEQKLETNKNLLVFSDPIFNNDDPRFSKESQSAENSNNETASSDKFRFAESLKLLERLPASKSESDSIINIIGSSKSDNFSGFAANRDQLLNLKTNNYKIIHFATHGTTDENRPELSGIILSRFDEKGRQRDESFRIHDIYGLNLNADLVVLSACKTGIGKEVKGEGLMSLNNAFLQVGAKSVMASLWKVEDTATLELMKSFYDSMKNKNLPPSQALREAQIKMWNNPQYKSPFYWAAFTIQGEYKRTPDLSNDPVYLIYFTIPLLILGLIGVYLWRKRRT